MTKKPWKNIDKWIKVKVVFYIWHFVVGRHLHAFNTILSSLGENHVVFVADAGPATMLRMQNSRPL